MKLYIANLAAYNNGILKGKWFDLEDFTDVNDLMEQVTDDVLDGDKGEEWAIHDYEAPFNVAEYESLKDIQAMIDFSNLDEREQTIAAYLKDNGNYSSLQDCVDNVEDVDFYEGQSLTDVAERLVEEGCFGDIPTTIQNYIDYDAIARDLSCDGYHETAEGVFRVN